MKRSKKVMPKVEIINYGRYAQWDRDSKKLPEFVELTTFIKSEIDVEFGMIVEIVQGKGRFLEYIIDHPPFRDNSGEVSPPFTGSYQIRSNPYRFFLGDTVWAPIEDKKGNWNLIIKIDGQEVAKKTIILF